MSALIQVSDPHFGTERPEVVEALVALVASARPQAVVLSGDITQRARTAQFAAARRFVDRLGLPLLAIPGNHDIPLYNLPARLFRPYAGYRRAFGDDLEPVFENAHWLVLGVKTTSRWRHKDGAVTPQQVARIAERLRRARPDQLRLVVTHQPMAVTRRKDASNVLAGAGEAARAWSSAGCDLVLGGHIHLPFVEPLTEHHEGLSRPVWAVQAGTALSSRVRDGVDNSVNLIRRTDAAALAHCVVERWDYRARSRRFERASATELRLGR